MTGAYVYYHSPVLPWSVLEDEEGRYWRVLKRSLLAFLLLALIIPFLPLPKQERSKVEQVPPRLAKLLLEQPPPPAQVKAPEPEAPKTEPQAEKPPAQKKPEPVAQTKRIEAARAKAERSGVLAFKDDLAELRSHALPTTVPESKKLATGTGTAPTAASGTPDRAVITSRATSGSGGINTASMSRETGGGGLGGQAGTTQLASPLGAGGTGVAGGGKRSGSGTSARTEESVRLVLDRNKGSIYALYSRALRENAGLQGRFVFKLTIDPSGRVTDCQVVSSELKSPELERKLVARIKQFDFGAVQGGILAVTYYYDFLPS